MSADKAYPNRKREGRCHVCGKQCSLSFEHVPPRSAGNASRAKLYSGVDVVKKQGFDISGSFDGLSYDQMQQGAGVYSICQSCNSYFGANYVEVFSEALKGARCLFESHPAEGAVNCTILETDKMHALAFFKHVVSSFCATTQYGTMLDCRDFLLEKESNGFPSRYRLFMFAVPDVRSRGVRTGWTRPFQGGTACQVAHLIMPPFGFSLLDLSNSTGDAPISGCDITSFSKCKWGELPIVHLELPHAVPGSLFPQMVNVPRQLRNRLTEQD